MFANAQWARHLFGRSPQSVVDSGDPLRHEESAHTEIILAGLKSPTSLPIDVTGCTGFQDLPDELLENIFRNLEGTSRKNYFAVCGVSRSWRRIGQSLFFATPWNTPHLICHPNQLFCLSPHTPIGSRSGLLKCFVRRERHATAGDIHGRRITLHLGKDPHQPLRARFLLCALQHSRHQTWIYLNGRCEGPPCARLISNLLCTSYTLVLEDGIAATLKQPETAAQVENDSMPPQWISSAEETTGLGTSSSSPRGGDASYYADEAGHSPKSPASPSSSSSSSSHMLLLLQYKARLKGLMQPRRMDASLPDPCTSPSVPSPLQKQCSLRPCLDHLSSVAVLELPPPASPSTPENVTSLGPATATMTATGAVTPSGDVPLTDEPTPEVGPSLPPANTSSPTPAAQMNASPGGGRGGGGGSNNRRLRSLLCGAGGGSLLRSSPRTAPEEIVTGPLPVRLHNKSPHWNDGLRCWCLNFRGRVKLASVKNFQLVKDGDVEDKVVMQFGKVDEDAFIMDFNPTAVSTIQAFAMALSTFDGKVML